MRLSIVIVNWNTTNLLKQCLKSIAAFPPEGDYEIIVVDNASSDFDETRFRAEFPDVHIIANAENAGYAKGNNQGIAIANGKFVLLLNPDTQVTEGALEALLKFMEEHPDAAAAGPRLVRPNGAVEQSVRSFPYPGPIAWEYLGLSRIFPKSWTFARYRMRPFSYTQEAEVDQPMGSCLILSRQALDSVGLMDESFPIFFNEVDWLYRAKQKGYKIYFTPAATVIHHGAASTSQVDRRIMLRESHESLIRFYKKHFRDLLPKPVYWLAILAIRLGVFFRR